MKKLFLIVMLLGLTLASQAQVALNNSQDTLTNADTAYLQAPRLTVHYGVVSLQLNTSKISGTVAGNAIIQASLDGINYAIVPGSDTLSFTNGNNTGLWNIGDNKFTHYRIQVITSGTQSSKVNGLIWYR